MADVAPDEPPESPLHSGPERASPLPDQVTMGLLPYLNAHALDDDYAVVARAREGEEEPERRRPRRHVGRYGAAVLALFAVLAVTAGVQASRNSGTDEQERQDLIAQISSRKASLDADRARVQKLQVTNQDLETIRLRSDDTTSGVLARLRLLGMRNGNTAVRGPGVRVVVDDAPGAAQDERLRVLDTDLQHLANGLWQAGAEAISINGERLTNLSAIRHAGSAITVNFRSLSKPYTVSAIGDPDRLAVRFGETTSGQTWLDLQREVGLKFSMKVVRSLSLPAQPIRQLRYALPADKSEKRLP